MTVSAEMAPNFGVPTTASIRWRVLRLASDRQAAHSSPFKVIPVATVKIIQASTSTKTNTSPALTS